MPSSMKLSEHLLSDLQFLLSPLYHMPKSMAVWGWVWLYAFSKPGFFLGSYIFMKTPLLSPMVSSTCCYPVSDSKVALIELLYSVVLMRLCPSVTSHCTRMGFSSYGSPKVCSGLALMCVLCLISFHFLQQSDFYRFPSSTAFSSALLLAHGSPGLLLFFKLLDQQPPVLPQGLCTCYC